MATKIIASRIDSMFEFVREMFMAYPDFVFVRNSDLNTVDISACKEFIAVQFGSWVPDRILREVETIKILNIEQMTIASRLEDSVNDYHRTTERAKKPIQLCDYSRENIAILGRRGIKAELIPVDPAESDVDKLHEMIKNGPKKYDVAFVGAMGQKRQKVIDEVRRRGLSVHIAGGFGDERDRQIAHAHCLLNIHYRDDYKVFESLRCNRWLAAGLTVISEDSLDIPDYPNLIMTKYDRIPGAIVSFINSIKTAQN